MREFHRFTCRRRLPKFILGFDREHRLAVDPFLSSITALLSLGRSPPHAPTHNANGPDGGLRQLQSPPRLKCLPKGRPSSRFRPWFFDVDGSGATGGSMIRHAPEAALFPVDPLPVPVIEPAFRALLVPPVGVPRLLPPLFLPASLPAIPVAPVTMPADPKHHATAGPPAKPLTQCLFAGPHPRPCGGTGQPRPVRAIPIPSTDGVGPFFRAGTKKPDRRLTARVFPSRLRPHPARASESLTDDEESTSLYRLSPKRARP